MPKLVTGAANTLLSTATGTEPFLVIGILWSSITGIKYYSSTALADSTIIPNISDFGELRIQRKSDNSSTTGNVSVTFSDTDGVIKGYVNSQVVEKAPAYIYLGYQGLTPADYILIYRGVATGPAKWNEGERKVTFDIEMQVESHELGYSATVADFPDINPEAQGIPWPMMFGTTAHVPALHIRKHITGRLQCAIRFYKSPSYVLNGGKTLISLKNNPDVFAFLLDAAPVKGVFYVEDGDTFPQSTALQILIEGVVFSGSFNGTKFTVTASNLPKYTNIQILARVGSDLDKDNYHVLWIGQQNGIYPPIVNHNCYFDGYESSDGGKEWHNKCIKQEGGKCWFRKKFISPNSYEDRYMTNGDVITSAYGISKNGMWQDIASQIDAARNNLVWKLISGKDPYGALISHISAMEDRANCWWTAFSDAEVRLWNVADPDIYIASLVPLSSVKAVFAKRHVEGGDGKTKEIFQQVPESYYTIQLVADYPVHSEEIDAPDFYPTGIIFPKALTEYEGQNWEDEIYVSGTSTIGPNPVDIIEWIFEKFTNLTVDAGSFLGTRGRVSALNANFALFDRRDALKMAEEIAYQCKCGLILDGQTAAIKYLALPPTTTDTYTEDDIELLSLDVTTTPTSEIITKSVASWTLSYREKIHLIQTREIKTREFEQILQSLIKHDRRTKSDTQYTVYRNNIGIYGLKSREDSCFIYNDSGSIQAFLNFWGYRKSNSWKVVYCKVPLKGLRLQVFDGLVISLTDATYLGGLTAVLCIVDSVVFSFAEKNCTIGLLVPVKTGTSVIDSLGMWPG